MIVNIRGCNGSGKSTVPLLMQEKGSVTIVKLGRGKTGKPCNPAITVFPDFNWVALGTYTCKTGGMDTLKNNQEIRQALEYALEKYPECDILMEGVIASTIKSTYASLFKELEAQGHQVLIMSYLPPLEVCLKRIQERNGGKPIKEELVSSKWRSVYSGVSYFKEAGFTSIKIDTSKCSRENMLKNFLKTVEKYRR